MTAEVMQQSSGCTKPRYTGSYATRSAYENALADKLRSELFAILGGECMECGERSNLEIDHPFGRGWVPRKLNRYRRHLRYWREAQEGLVRLLCRDCNMAIKPVKGGMKQVETEGNPF